ncbi:MAG: hypothetical protein V4700_02930 [Pseudomonadota bacterium]
MEENNNASKCEELRLCYWKALRNYRKRESREDCAPTFFTRFRHSFKEYPALCKLRKALGKEQDSIPALTLIADHFVSKTATFHNHSFNNYFLDALRNSTFFNHIDWDCFTPKAVKKYTGLLPDQPESSQPRLLYRGDTRSPSIIFKEGFKEKHSSNFDSDYQKYHNGAIGISTSKDLDVAIQYPKPSKQATRSVGIHYVYAIDYRGSDGFDILKTGQARGINFSHLLGRDRYAAIKDKEVNIKGFISSENICGAFTLTDGKLLSWNENTEYTCSQNKTHNYPNASTKG